MGKPKMLILRGNNSGPGMFPDEQGNLIDWPIGENPDRSQLPPGLPKDTKTHMCGPDVLLSGWPE